MGDAEDGGHEGSIINVAPVISDEKARFVLRQLLSTFLGGVKTSRAVGFKAHLVQFLLWALPPALCGCVAQGLAGSPAEIRFLIAGGACTSFLIIVEIVRWSVCRFRSDEDVREAWFSDYDEVDYSDLLSPATCRALFPAKCRGDTAICFGLSFVLCGTSAGVLDTNSIEEDLGGGSGSAVALSICCLFSLATAQYGLTACPPVELTTDRYREPMTIKGLLADYSRPLLLLVLLLPTFTELQRPLGAHLRAVVAALPFLWTAGIVPQLDTLISWMLDQLEVHLFGGSPMPHDLRLIWGVAVSAAAAAGVALMAEAARGDGDCAASAITAILLGLFLAGVLSPLPPRLDDIGRSMFHYLGLAELQALLGAALGLGILFALGVEEVQASIMSSGSQVGLEFGTAWAVRLLLEQLSAGLCCTGLYLATARLRVSFGSFPKLSNKPRYLAARQDLLGTKRPDGCSSPPTMSAHGGEAATAAAIAEVVAETMRITQVPARLALLAHAAAYGGVSLCSDATPLQHAFEAAVFLRAFRIALADPFRAAGDTWFLGMLDVFLFAAGFEETSFWQWSFSSRLFLVSSVRGRCGGLFARAEYAVHLARVTSRLPKLRHPVTGKLLLANAILFPLLIVILLCSAVLESPLVALFTLPCFTVGYIRARHGHPELPPANQPLTKGIEGLFYSILMPSLLRGLAPRWRADALSRRPGALLLCRSHERLLCLVRVLGAGLGWVNVELRGLEMQEPTSCHHVEAALIDDAFTAAFSETLPTKAIGLASGSSHMSHQSSSESDSDSGTTPNLQRPFVLEPVCEVMAVSYEQIANSARGIIDNPDTLHQLHRLFLKTLVWVMGKHRQSGKPVPLEWLSCPLKAHDSQAVLNLIRASTWRRHVGTVLGLPEADVEKGCTVTTPVFFQLSDSPKMMGKDARLSATPSISWSEEQILPGAATPEASPATQTSAQRGERMFDDGRRSPELNGRPMAPAPAAEDTFSPAWKPSSVSDEAETTDVFFGVDPPLPPVPPTQPSHLKASPPTNQPHRMPATKEVSLDDLDTLMDMVMEIGPAAPVLPPSRVAPDDYEDLSDDASSCTSSRSEKHHKSAAVVPAQHMKLGQKSLPPLSTNARTPEPLKQDVIDLSGDGESAGHPSPRYEPQQASPQPFDDLDSFTKLVVQAYTAVNIAPAFGKNPETLGPLHVFRVFTGQFSQMCQAAEVTWLEKQPEFRNLTVLAFRYAFKVAFDCAAMADDVGLLGDAELEQLLRELDESWHIDEDDSPAWSDAMERRVPNLMALRKKGPSEYQVLRLALKTDGVRVAEMKEAVVHSIWASASLELRYFTNDDDERYSIQAHPTLFRNLVVQSAEYPIFVSPPTTVWL